MEIKTYSTQTCLWCKALKPFLKERGADCKDIDLSQAAAIEMIEKSGRLGVPQIDTDCRRIIGFDKQAIKELSNIGI